MKRGGRIKPKKRKPSEFARIYGSPARVRFVARLGCVVCGRTPAENAHTESGGMGRKADADTIVPLCGFHHRELHFWGADTFADCYEVNLRLEALATDELWKARAA